MLLIVLRVLHIGAGVFWAGTMMFASAMLGPAIGDAGPGGGAVMAALMKRGMMTKIPIAATVTILSGLWMFWIVSNHFQAPFMGSHFGNALSIGMLAAIVAFAIGMTVVRPTQLKIVGMMPGVNAMPDGAEKQAKMTEVQGMRAKAMKGGKLVSALLGVAVLMMAVARYI
jgi:hypothetical protein